MPSLLLLLLLVILSCFASGPPRPLTVPESLLKVFPLGSSVVLPCPVHSDPQSLFHEWSRDGEPLDDSFGGRIRVTTTGSLRIRTASLEDSGRYACKAVNGFGAVTANLTLIVLGPGMNVDDVILPTPEAAVPLPPPAPPDKDFNFTHSVDRSPTSWEPAVELVQRPVGGSARLRCGAESSPRPPVTWFRNGRELSPNDARRSRWTLGFQGLTPGDSGNYSCLFRNYSASAIYALQVVERLQNKPELTGSHPLNTTVQAGDSASFQCRVRSEVPPHIQWLKLVEPSTQGPPSLSEGEAVQEGQVIKVLGESFRVLRSSEVQERPDGSYLNKLLVPEAGPQDAGKYLCLGANSLGYSFRSAYLHVLANPAPSPVNWSHGLFSGSGRSGSLLMAIPILLGVLVGVLVALVLRCQRRKGAESPATPRTPICNPPAPATPQRTSGSYGIQDTGHRITNGSTDTKVTWTSRGGGQQTWSSGSSSLVTDSSLHYPLGCSDPGAYLLLRSNSPYLPASLCTSEAVLQHTGPRGNVVSSRLYAPSPGLFPRLSPPPPHLREICANGYKNCV